MVARHQDHLRAVVLVAAADAADPAVVDPAVVVRAVVLDRVVLAGAAADEEARAECSAGPVPATNTR